jgi:hypothetical protein
MPSCFRSIHFPAAHAAWLATLMLAGPSVAAERAPDSTANPMGGAGSAVLERIPDPPPVTPTRRIVFTCVTPGLTIFSDRPCGPLPERLAIEWPPARKPRGGEAASVSPPQARASTRPAAVTGRSAPDLPRAADPGQECEALRRAVTAVDRQMRAGYSAREAPRLWERWREAKNRLHSAGCS